MVLMHFGFFLYTCYSVIGKIASRFDAMSLPFIIAYGSVFVILFVYAILWQQVLKVIPLTTATANKTITIVWGIVFGIILFKEHISLHMYLGALLILIGIIVLSSENEANHE